MSSMMPERAEARVSRLELMPAWEFFPPDAAAGFSLAAFAEYSLAEFFSAARDSKFQTDALFA